MKKSILIVFAAVFAIFGLVVGLLYHESNDHSEWELLCNSSVSSALEHFEDYNKYGKESDYIAGVAEFRTYMKAYLMILDGVSNPEYLWCNSLYGAMTIHPDRVQGNIPDLLGALRYLSEDYDHPNGFNLINALNHQIDSLG